MLKKIRIFVENHGEIKTDPGHLFLSVLNNHDIDLHNDCGGNGKCGRCKMVFEDDPPPPLGGDKRHLKPDEIERGVRLACFHQVRTDCRLSIPPDSRVDLLDEWEEPNKSTE